jgi:hypothetical protein
LAYLPRNIAIERQFCPRSVVERGAILASIIRRVRDKLWSYKLADAIAFDGTV